MKGSREYRKMVGKVVRRGADLRKTSFPHWAAESNGFDIAINLLNAQVLCSIAALSVCLPAEAQCVRE